ncbi:MAG: hypothetical protein CSA38_03520 [Flavobacteriales bacterium]|nr:MAG: hypothetical protein CSA38_03520 [Flavobacteriales bacterium]
MKKVEILQLGWVIFGIFFLLGNVALFGYWLTDNPEFALMGYFLLIFGTLINSMVALIFIILSYSDQENAKIWRQSALILLLNIPIALVYAYVGLIIL